MSIININRFFLNDIYLNDFWFLNNNVYYKIIATSYFLGMSHQTSHLYLLLKHAL